MTTEQILMIIIALLAVVVYVLYGRIKNYKKEIKNVKLEAHEDAESTKKEYERERQHLIEKQRAEIDRINSECDKKIQSTLEYIEQKKKNCRRNPKRNFLLTCYFLLVDMQVEWIDWKTN